MTPWTAAHEAPLFFTISQSLLRFMSIELVILSNHLILHHLFLLLPSIFSSIRVLSNESSLCIRLPKYWSLSFSFSVTPFQWIFKTNFLQNWLVWSPEVQGTFKSLLQHHNSKASVLAEWIQKQDPYICCLQETHLKTGDTYRLKVKGSKKIFHANRDQKKAGVAILIK